MAPYHKPERTFPPPFPFSSPVIYLSVSSSRFPSLYSDFFLPKQSSRASSSDRDKNAGNYFSNLTFSRDPGEFPARRHFALPSSPSAHTLHPHVRCGLHPFKPRQWSSLSPLSSIPGNGDKARMTLSSIDKRGNRILLAAFAQQPVASPTIINVLINCISKQLSTCLGKKKNLIIIEVLWCKSEFSTLFF